MRGHVAIGNSCGAGSLTKRAQGELGFAPFPIGLKGGNQVHGTAKDQNTSESF